MSSYSRSIAGSNSNISSSVLNLSRLKAFRSLKNLDQVQISLKSKRRPRNASEGELSIQSKLRDRLHPEDPGTLHIVKLFEQWSLSILTWLWNIKFLWLGFTSQPISTSSPKASPERSLNVTDATSVTSKGSRKVDVSKISRLLDHLTYDDDGLCEYDDMEYANTDDICFYPVIEDVLDKGR